MQVKNSLKFLFARQVSRNLPRKDFGGLTSGAIIIDVGAFIDVINVVINMRDVIYVKLDIVYQINQQKSYFLKQ